jgi:LytR cell envelope-related transcriptional attenuator
VDHPLRAADTRFAAIRPWRTATLVASGIAACELVLLLILGGTLLAHHSTTTRGRARPAESQRHPVSTARPRKPIHHVPAARLARSHVSVVVLNGNGRSGAAASAARRVRSHGYRIKAVGNAARMTYSGSMVMYRPGFEGEGRRLARDLGVRLVGPLDGVRLAELHGAQAVFILGA